jgi:hypothetical protein
MRKGDLSHISHEINGDLRRIYIYISGDLRYTVL